MISHLVPNIHEAKSIQEKYGSEKKNFFKEREVLIFLVVAVD